MNETCSNMLGKEKCTSPFMNTPLDDESMRTEVLSETTNGRLATIYVPWQGPGSSMFSICEGLEKGTIYKDLYQPYKGKGEC